jgi:hypothetical protein
MKAVPPNLNQTCEKSDMLSACGLPGAGYSGSVTIFSRLESPDS